MKVLIVTNKTYHTLKYHLEKENHRVEISLLGDVPQCLDHHHAEVVIIDWGENNSDGLSALRELKVSRPEVPVIVLSHSGSEEIAVTSFRLGAKDYFKWPVIIPELIESLNNLHSMRRISPEKRFPFLTREGTERPVFVKVPKNLSPKIHRVLLYLEDNVSDSIKLEDLANVAGMSKYHFCRNFKKELNSSPVQFLTTLRIERAQKLLKETPLSISKISREVGYNDVSNFIKNFKNINGVTPAAYKKSLKNKP